MYLWEFFLHRSVKPMFCGNLICVLPHFLCCDAMIWVLSFWICSPNVIDCWCNWLHNHTIGGNHNFKISMLLHSHLCAAWPQIDASVYHCFDASVYCTLGGCYQHDRDNALPLDPSQVGNELHRDGGLWSTLRPTSKGASGCVMSFKG
jgi:hypothetical protein